MNATSTPDAPAPAQPTLVQLVFSDRQALSTTYIPLFTEGGLFIATAHEHRLGDAFELLLTLPGETERRTVAGKVAWITPAHAPGGRPQGVGVAFNGSEESRAVKALIESLLADSAGARSTQVF
ncbi:PilZ domain-containing protein [Azohydromonas lata]|uniref:PilZ domain-containing protein n=1 Tax=Azohydromonas lata TaxID=45677 RepID=A0ABU5IGX2_9BURK|nr:PilZ domain-containing protein [Azohydromonas lata]MDZ5458314.1 PilZ domain-containing protein [Azohydromonas lata]